MPRALENNTKILLHVFMDPGGPSPQSICVLKEVKYKWNNLCLKYKDKKFLMWH